MYSFLRTIMFSSLNSIVKILLEIFVMDRQIRSILKGKWTQLYLKKYVKKAYNKFKNIENTMCEPTKILWQFWEQGIENAPDIVKSCVKTVEKFKGDYQHIILTMDNLSEYVTIPQLFYDLKEKGIIKSAHFSDIVRTYLLEQNGGVWLDATLYLMKPIPEYILNSEIFLFQNNPNQDKDKLGIASYFIVSKKNNTILKQAEYIFESYWKENRFLNNYFMFLHAFTLITKLNSESWAKVPFFNYLSIQRMQDELLEPFNQKRYEQFKDMSFIHKLTYKRKVMGHRNLDNFTGTLYEKIINGELDNE